MLRLKAEYPTATPAEIQQTDIAGPVGMFRPDTLGHYMGCISESEPCQAQRLKVDDPRAARRATPHAVIVLMAQEKGDVKRGKSGYMNESS